MAFSDSFSGLQDAQERIAEQNAANYFRQNEQDERVRMDNAGLDQNQASFLAGLRRDQLNRDMSAGQQNYFEMSGDRAAKMDQARIDLAKRAQAFNETTGNPATIRDTEYMLKAAQDAAQRGEFTSADDVQQFNPKLSPAQAAIIADQSIEVRKQQASAYMQAKQMADVLNSHKTTSEGAVSAKAAGTKPWYQPNDSDEIDYAKVMQDHAEKLQPAVDRIMKTKNLDALVTQDPESGFFHPTMLPPRGANYFQSASHDAAPAAPESPEPDQPKVLTLDLATNLLKQSGGDKEKARALAHSLGYTW